MKHSKRKSGSDFLIVNIKCWERHITLKKKKLGWRKLDLVIHLILGSCCMLSTKLGTEDAKTDKTASWCSERCIF